MTGHPAGNGQGAATPSHVGRVKVSAPGKINASFRVGPLRKDGYHSVASTYLAVSLYEDVLATAKPGTPATDITISLSPDSTLPPEQLDRIPLDGSNLAARAAALVADLSENPCGVHLEITKRVPIAGGMGGGSADAAATLLACDALWHCGLSKEELSLLGAELGADVPFALLGGAAVGLGVGDQLTAALAPMPLNWVLVQSDFGLSTPSVYAELDSLRATEEVQTPDQVDPQILVALRSGDPVALAPYLINDLQRAATHLAPGLEHVLAAGLAHGALATMVSGSGPTVAMLAHDAGHAGLLADSLLASGHQAIAVDGPVHGAHRV